MRTLAIFTLVLIAIAGSGANENAAAPQPKDNEPKLSIEGKYTLLSVSSPDDRAGGGGFGRVGGIGGGAG